MRDRGGSPEENASLPPRAGSPVGHTPKSALVPSPEPSTTSGGHWGWWVFTNVKIFLRNDYAPRELKEMHSPLWGKQDLTEPSLPCPKPTGLFLTCCMRQAVF